MNFHTKLVNNIKNHKIQVIEKSIIQKVNTNINKDQHPIIIHNHVQDVEPKVTMQKFVDEVKEKCATNVIKQDILPKCAAPN